MQSCERSERTLCLSTINAEISWERRTSGHDDCVVLGSYLVGREIRIHADVSPGHELDALLSEKVKTSLQDELLVQLHVLYHGEILAAFHRQICVHLQRTGMPY